MAADHKTARIAGLLYLGVVITGIINLGYVPSKLIVWNDAAATVKNISSQQLLFKWGLVSGILCYCFFLFLPFALYRLLQPVHDTAAKLMVVLAVVSVPMSLLNLQHKFALLSLINDPMYLQLMNEGNMKAQVMFQLQTYSSGNRIIEIFWGLWLFPFGYLVYKSNFLPKLLGIFLMLGCIGYLIAFFGKVFINGYADLAIASYISIPSGIGEIGTCLWLLIMGARKNFSRSADGATAYKETREI